MIRTCRREDADRIVERLHAAGFVLELLPRPRKGAVGQPNPPRPPVRIEIFTPHSIVHQGVTYSQRVHRGTLRWVPRNGWRLSVFIPTLHTMPDFELGMDYMLSSIQMSAQAEEAWIQVAATRSTSEKAERHREYMGVLAAFYTGTFPEKPENHDSVTE